MSKENSSRNNSNNLKPKLDHLANIQTEVSQDYRHPATKSGHDPHRENDAKKNLDDWMKWMENRI